MLPLQNRVNFIAFSGRQYSDSPRRISELLHKEHPEIQQVWAFTEPEKFRFLEEKGIKVVKYKSLEYLYYVMTSRVYVDNAELLLTTPPEDTYMLLLYPPLRTAPVMELP